MHFPPSVREYTRAHLDPQAANTKSGYDSYILTRSFLREVIFNIEHTFYVFLDLNNTVILNAIEDSIRVVLADLLKIKEVERDSAYYKDLSYRTGIPAIMTTPANIDSYITLLRNSFMRGIELGMITVTVTSRIGIVNSFKVKLNPNHPRHIKTAGKAVLDAMVDYWNKNNNAPLPDSFYNDELRLKNISPYLVDSDFIGKYMVQS